MSQERRSGSPRDAPGTRFGSAAPVRAQAPPAELTYAQAGSYGFNELPATRAELSRNPKRRAITAI